MHLVRLPPPRRVAAQCSSITRWLSRRKCTVQLQAKNALHDDDAEKTKCVYNVRRGSLASLFQRTISDLNRRENGMWTRCLVWV